MVSLQPIQVSAAIAAAACLLCPLAGRLIIKWRESRGWRRPLHPALAMLTISLIGISILILGWSGAVRTQDALFVGFFALSIGFGLTGERFVARRAVKVFVQVVLATLIVANGVTLHITRGDFPILNGALTVLFILSILNLLVVVNFIGGLSSLVVFILSALAAVMLNLPVGTEIYADPSLMIFALCISGLSLWYFIYSRPSAKAYMGDYGTLMLNLTLAMLLVRISEIHDQILSGAMVNNPAILLPLLLVIPILLASLRREQRALFRRARLALILILIGHVPYAIALMTTGRGQLMGTTLLGIASLVAWTGVITHGRTLRGWSMRCLAEPIADVLRISLGISAVSLAAAVVLGLSAWCTITSCAMTSLLLITFVALWRRASQAGELPEVVVVGSHEDYRKCQFILLNCEDLFGRRRARRLPYGVNSKHFRDETNRELLAGKTVVVLNRSARRKLIGLRGYDDLIFAQDCLLLRHIDESLRPRQWPATAEIAQDVLHRFAALLLILFLAPLGLLIAAAIRLDDGGPIFFRQRRLGHNGRRFTVYKFRSMRIDAPRYGESPRSVIDVRVTRVGRLLRRLSLDELPQLFNILAGDMRLVGPRPEMPFICSKYTPYQRQRLTIPAGLTGLWQISPHRNDPIHDHVEYDLAYACARGPILDLAIMIATVFDALKSGY